MALRTKIDLMTASNQTTSTTGSAFFITRPTANRFAATLVFNNDSGSTPTLDAKVQESFDNVTWFDFLTFTQKTTGSGSEKVHANTMTTHPGPYFRAVTTLAGTSPQYDVTIRLLHD